MESHYSESKIHRSLLTLESVLKTIDELLEWNEKIKSAEDYHSTLTGVQLLTANCTLITAIGEGINRINRATPNFLSQNFPNIPWNEIIGMRNHIVHGYFALNADIVYRSIRYDFPELRTIIEKAIKLLSN